MRFYLLFFFVVSVCTIQAEAITLRGTITGAEGNVLRVYHYDDLVSLRKMKLASAVISASGSFEVEFNLLQTNIIFLNIDFHQTEMIVEPGHKYDIKIEGFEKSGYREEVNAFLNPPSLRVFLTDIDSHLLNQAYDSLNALSDKYLIEHGASLLRRGIPDNVDSIIMQWKNALPASSPFLETAVTYRMAQLTSGSGKRGQLKVFHRFIMDKPVYQEHPEYVSFFAQFFDKHLTTSRSLPFHEMVQILNGSMGYLALLDFLGRDSMLRNDIIREFALLVNVRDLYFNPDIYPASVLDILTQMAGSTSFPVHRRIAVNLLHELQRLKPGTPAPSITLRSPKGENLSLHNLQGKYVYLQFYTSWCTACIADMQLMEKLQQEFGDTIHFVSISVDLEPARNLAFLQRYKYPWDFVHFDGNHDLLDAYKIRAYPTYIFIDPKGNIAASPALSPADGVAVYFSRMLSPLLRP